MARKPKPGKCVHCLSDPVERNWDHVFPESWYPDSTPDNLEKWQIPSCIACNSKYGKIESDLLSRIALCLDPHDAASSSVVQRALRSMREAAGRDERDRAKRAARRRHLLSETLRGAAIPAESTWPGMGNRWNAPPEEQVAILVSADDLRLIAEKVVRGVFFVEDERYIEPPFKIEHWVLNEEVTQEWKAMLNKFGTIYTREPGIVVHRAVVPEDSTSSVFEIVFWKQFVMHATVSDETRDAKQT
jgi:hypothetical protein